MQKTHQTWGIHSWVGFQLEHQFIALITLITHQKFHYFPNLTHSHKWRPARTSLKTGLRSDNSLCPTLRKWRPLLMQRGSAKALILLLCCWTHTIVWSIFVSNYKIYAKGFHFFFHFSHAVKIFLKQHIDAALGFCVKKNNTLKRDQKHKMAPKTSKNIDCQVQCVIKLKLKSLEKEATWLQAGFN